MRFPSLSLAAWIGAALLTALLFFPLFSNQFYVDVIAKALILGIFALSIDLSWGYAGVLSLGQAVFFGMGAYAYTMATKGLPVGGSAYPGLAMAILLPAALAAAVAYVGCRRGTHEVYFAIITLAVSLIFEKIVIESYNITGGSNGITNIPPVRLGIPGYLEVAFDTPARFYYLTVGICLLAFYLSRRVVLSPFGRVLEALRENQDRAEFLGYNITRYKVIIFAVSGGMAGVAGSLYAPLNGIVYPELFGLLLSAQVLIWVAIGGRGTLLGPFLGALLANPMETILGDVSVKFYLLAMGALFSLVVIFFPRGLAGFLRGLIEVRPRAMAR